MRNLILLISALLISAILLPICFVFTLIFKGRTEFLFRTAISIDQLGNVVGAKLFNIALIKSNGWQFGCEDETISSVLGKNKRLGLLKPLGRALDKLLDAIDKGHSINAIEE